MKRSHFALTLAMLLAGTADVPGVDLPRRMPGRSTFPKASKARGGKLNRTQEHERARRQKAKGMLP